MSRSTALMLLITLLVSGCATESNEPVSFPGWQQSLEHYIWQQGDGDPTVLRDLSWDDLHPGFAVLGEALPQQSTDIFGLLLAHQHVQGKPYFVFLVATVQNGALEELKPVALNVEAGRFHWFVGRENSKSFASYKAWLDLAEPGPPDQPPVVQFPASQDTFGVQSRSDQISIIHRQTGAAWQIPLASDRATQPHDREESSWRGAEDG